MNSSVQESKGLRNRMRRRLSRLRDKYVDSSTKSLDQPPLHVHIDPSLTGHAPGSISENVPSFRTSVTEPVETRTPGFEPQPDQGSLRLNEHEQSFHIGDLTRSHGSGSNIAPPDIWSAAYREAVESLGDATQIAALKGKDLAQLFQELEESERDLVHGCALFKGVKYLQTLQVPLERLKQALDLASPLANLEPTATTVVGVVRCVTAIAIGFANVDSKFTEQLQHMLQHIPYIDECDTLGQNVEEEKIHKALVLVYQKVLEFYKTVCDIFARKGAKLFMRMVLEHDHLPSIVQDFLRSSRILHNLVQTATFRIMQEIHTMLLDKQIDGWLDKEKVTRQGQTHNDLERIRENQACEFILSEAKFIDWYRASNSQTLTIFGEMGCGKTVLMSFLVEQLRQLSDVQIPRPKTCYYYCESTGTSKATSIISTLILELLNELGGLKRPFTDWYRSAQTSVLDPASNPRKLQELLEKTFFAIDRPVFVIIDGLDECDMESRDILFNALEHFSRTSSKLKVLLSSRPRQDILDQLSGTPHIALVSNAERDGMIVEKSVEKRLPRLSPDVKSLIKTKLSKKACGSAIWTNMVVGLIEIRGIKSYGPMKHFLENLPLPDKLSDLYGALISRSTSNDRENLNLAIIALRILAIQWRPMSILELAWAVTLKAAPNVTTVGGLSNLVDHHRIIDLIHPFIVHIDFGNVKKHQVRLAHQSVREFVLHHLINHRVCEVDLEGTVSPRAGQPESLHAFILDICIKYLLLEDIGDRNLFSEEQLGILELPQEPELLIDDERHINYDPKCTWETWEEDMIRFDPSDRGFGEFFVYASCHWLNHFGTITDEPFPSLANIELLCKAGSTRLSNWIQQNCRPGCAMIPRVEFDSSLYDPLSITSLYGPISMLLRMAGESDFDSDLFLPKSAFSSADQIFQWGVLLPEFVTSSVEQKQFEVASRLRLLFSNKVLGRQLRNLEFFQLAIKRWKHPGLTRHNWDLIFDLVDDVTDKMIDEKWANELFYLAASEGCMPILLRLIATAQHRTDLHKELFNDTEEELGDTPLHIATRKGERNVIKMLVHAGADLDRKDQNGKTPLQIAIECGNERLVRTLLNAAES